MWKSGDRGDAQQPLKAEAGRTYYHHVTFAPPQGGVPIRIAVEDLVATQVDSEDEETRELKLTYWIGQVAALFEEDGEKRFILRFFDLPSQWKYMNGDDKRLLRTFNETFRKFEVMETDVCEVNPVDIIVKKLNWWSNESEAVIDNTGLKQSDIPNGVFTDRMIIRCGTDGKRRDDLSDSLWPAPAARRRNRLLVQCEASKLSIKAGGWMLNPLAPLTQQTVEDPVYARAVDMLKLSVLPENLPCREAETATIREFIKTAVRTTGTSGNVLYISGVPGTGKTASVLSVVTAMQKHSKDSEKFEFAYINSMKLNTPTDLYVDLLNKLWLHKRKFASDKPQEKLTEFFASNDKNRPITVLLVDEIDYLVTKSQAVVYQLFDWPLLATSKLVLLTISNTMDLPERLMPRVASRLGLARLNYLPYNHEQIKKVISERMRDAKAERIFADDAVTFVARRVAASSGDIRKALHICRRAIEMREGPVVKAADINRAQFDLYSNPYVAVISHLPYFARLVMIAMVKETTVKNAESVNLRDIWLRFSNLLNSHAPAFQTRKFYYSDFQRVLNDLAIMNLVQVSKFSGPAPCDKPQLEIVTPGDEEGELMEAGTRAVSKNQTGKSKKCKVVAKDNGAEEDEDGSGYLVSLNPLIENKDVKHALVEEAGDRVAQRWLL